jgi:hypothetical protein
MLRLGGSLVWAGPAEVARRAAHLADGATIKRVERTRKRTGATAQIVV